MSHERAIADESDQGTEGPPIKLILLLLVVAALITFFFQNRHKTSIEFLWIDVTWPIWAVIGVSAVAGALIDRLAGWMWSRRHRG